MKLMIFIPAYQAAHTICSVLEKIPKDIVTKAASIVVMDNNSPDKTNKVVEAYKKKKKLSKLTVIRHPKNIFFGGNLKAGFRWAIDHKMDIMAVLHADGQYPAHKLQQLIEPIEKRKAATTFGSRFLQNPLKGKMPVWRYLGNIFLTQIENILVGTRYSEWHSGFCAYDINVLKKLPYKKCESGYELTTDILLLFITNKYKVVEIPIPTHYGEESTSPSISRTFSYFIHSFRLAFVYFLHKIGVVSIPKYRRIKK